MNENIDLTKILEGCPKGTKFYSSNYGEVAFVGLANNNKFYQIELRYHRKDNPDLTVAVWVTKEGKSWFSYGGECTLFPSKDQRNWSKFERFWDKSKTVKFDVNTFQPFDKILARDNNKQLWVCDFFSHIDNEDSNEFIVSLCSSYDFCIPYNEETKHLLNTREDCPDYYKWWEE